MSADATDRDEDLPELLDDLETTLAELRSELRGDAGPGASRRPATRRTARDRSESGPALPRPPSVSDLLGFTEQYTIPALISTLEATIRALELLRGSLRLIDPDRSTFDEASTGGPSRMSRLGTGAAGVGRGAVSGVERALSELETALANSEVPADRASDELLGEIRDLSAEVRERLEAAQDREAGDRTGRRQGIEGVRRDATARGSDADGVTIEVTDGEAAGSSSGDDRGDDDRPEVDVEAELASIKHEVHGTEDGDPVDGGIESPDGDPESTGGDHRSGHSGGDEGSGQTDSGADQ